MFRSQENKAPHIKPTLFAAVKEEIQQLEDNRALQYGV